MGKTPRQMFGQQVGKQAALARVAEQPGFGVDARQQVEADRRPFVLIVSLRLPVA